MIDAEGYAVLLQQLSHATSPRATAMTSCGHGHLVRCDGQRGRHLDERRRRGAQALRDTPACAAVGRSPAHQAPVTNLQVEGPDRAGAYSAHVYYFRLQPVTTVPTLPRAAGTSRSSCAKARTGGSLVTPSSATSKIRPEPLWSYTHLTLRTSGRLSRPWIAAPMSPSVRYAGPLAKPGVRTTGGFARRTARMIKHASNADNGDSSSIHNRPLWPRRNVREDLGWRRR